MQQCSADSGLAAAGFTDQTQGLALADGKGHIIHCLQRFGCEKAGSGFGKAATLFVAFNEVYYGIYPILDAAEAAAWYSYGAKCFAAPVRCVKE